MTAPENEGKPATPLDAERARLRAAGYSDAEISQILIARASAPPSAPHSPGVLSNVLGSIMAAGAYTAGLFTSLRTDAATIFGGGATAGARAGAFLTLLLKLAVIALIGFGAWQEWQQHILSAPQTAVITVDLTAAQAAKAKEDAKVAAEVAAGQAAQAKKAEEDAKVAAEVARGQAADARRKEAEAKYAEELAAGQKAQACTQRMEMLTKTLSLNDLLSGVGMDEFNKDCNPKFAGCTEKFNDVIATIKVPRADVKDFTEHTKEISDKLTAYKHNCGWRESERDAALEAYRSIGVNLELPSPPPTETTEARAPAAVQQPPAPAPSPPPATTQPYRTPTIFNCTHATLGVDFVVCDNSQLMDAMARLEDAYAAARAAKGDAIKIAQREWSVQYGPDCGLPKKGRPSSQTASGAQACVFRALNNRIEYLQSQSRSN